MTIKCFLIEKLEKKIVENCEGGGTITKPVYRLPDGREVTFCDIPIGAIYRDPEHGLVVVIPTRGNWNGQADTDFATRTAIPLVGMDLCATGKL